ncbi:Matrix-remodeling-associated protein 5 [Collichthys lucidus]|uniref:Matrix-remodeling-associated protein 5 n=1 Tax=Collichthys lucidus TaxID=240159 RepID=A0A4U5U015_COLLU|nr:Matrix-remodeling-associated protein 5 [Collichthys lucidus]
MFRRVCLLLAVLTLLMLTLLVPMGQACPRSCNCYQASEVHCTFRSLLTIPPGLPAHTRRINLGFNSISGFHDSSLAGLKKAELLMLHSNDLHHLPDGAFRDMKSLQICQQLKLFQLSSIPGEQIYHKPHRNTTRQAGFHGASPLKSGLMKCPGGPQCPICSSPNSLQGLGLLEQTNLSCTSPVIPSPGRDTPLETEISEIQSSESFREPLGSAFLGLSDHQGDSVDLSCNITYSSESKDIAPPPDLSLSSPSPLPLALSLSLDCPVERESYEKLWRILAYYSETAVHLDREIMLSKAPGLAYRYKQAAETDGYYHTGVKASVKISPQWLLQPAISIQLNRAQSNGHKVQLIYSTRVSARPDPASHPSITSPASHPWVLISTNHTTTALVAAAGSKVELPCPVLSSGNPKVQWILPDGYKQISPSNSLDGRPWASPSGLLLHKVQLSDAGIYYCVARAGRDVDVLPIRLAVEESSIPPSGEQVGLSVSGTVGEPISLSCKASGSPVPHMSWLLPDGNIVRQGLAVSGITIQSNGSLTLPNPSQGDAGHYRCIVLNQYGSDSLSMQLELQSRHPPQFRTSSFPRGPQSAAGRSTQIRAPLLHQVVEGSGNEEEDEEEEERTHISNRKRPRPLQPSPNRRYPIGKPRRRGPVREGSLRKEGGPVSSTDQRRNRFENRRRVTANKQRIDPQKWADILAKIRQKTANTNNNQPIAAGKPTAKSVGRGQGRERQEGDDDAEIVRAEGAGVEAETEGSSVDNADLQEEDLQPIHPVHPGMQTHRETKSDTDTDTEIKKGPVRSEQTHMDMENETETHIQREKAGPQTETVTNPEIQREAVTSKPISGTNEIFSEPGEGDEREANPSRSRMRPQKPRQGLFPNLVPNSQHQSPWNSRRRIGQRRRIINRPRGRPLSPPRPLPDPMNPKSPTTTPETTTAKMDMSLLVSATTSPAIFLTQSDHISNTLSITTSKSSPSLTPSSSSLTSLSSSRTKTHIDMMTHSVTIPDAAEPQLGDSDQGLQTHTSGQCHSQLRALPDWLVKLKESRSPPSHGPRSPQNVQLQDRGTYICSAHSFLGRDRLLTTLEVWTRPPRMQLASYREATIHQGGEVHLECQADGVPSPLLSWVLPDRSVLTSTARSTSRVTMDTNGTLHILQPLPSDRGVYRCVASNSAGAASASVRVHVSSLPPVIQQHKEQHLLKSPGMPVYAQCSARGAPPPTLRWRIPDGTLVRPSQFLHGNLFVLPNGTLHIRKVGPKDTGIYECTASNAVGSDKRTVRVEIKGGAEGDRRQGGARHEEAKEVPTEKTSSPSSLNKNKTLSIPSHPSNSFNSPRLSPPSPFDRSRTLPITPSSSRSSSHQLNHSNSLTPKINEIITASPTHLTTVNKTKPSPLSPPPTGPTNNTKVSPGIVNNARVTSSSPADKSRASAVFHPSPLSPFSKARIVSTSPSITAVHYGGLLQLHCSVIGNPSPIIIWRTPSRKLVDMHFSFDRRLKVHPNGTLSVQAVTEKDAGDYLCIARNKVADDYRLLRVSVATKPAKIEPRQPLNQMVLFGKPLKVDCQASGLPDPAVHWSLPDGTMVNSVLQGEGRGGRARRLTVFDNGTLLVPAVGMGEEGEYTCYAENQGGQDTMKVKVKVMMTSPPTFTHGGSYHIVKVRQGATATIRCHATGDPAPTVTWFSPTRRVIPRSLGSGLYSDRVVAVSDGTLEVRLAQTTDTGNYTCRASNSVGERSMMVGLEVEPANYDLSRQVGGRGWSTSSEPRPGVNINNVGIIQNRLTNGVTSKLGGNNSSNDGYSADNGRIKNIVPNTGINVATSGSDPALRSDSQNGFSRPVSGVTTQLSSSVVVGRNIGIKADNTEINRNGPGIVSSSNSTVRGDLEKNPGANNNEVIAGKASNDANTGISRNVGFLSSSVSNIGAGTGTLRGNAFSGSSNIGVTNGNRNRGGSSSTAIAAGNTGTINSANTVVGVVTTVKQRVVKGQTVLLPCPSQGSPPPRVSWLLSGNGVLPAPYYGSRLTVHRNGSLELRGVRVTDGGTLVCVVRGERGETRIQVELEVSEQQQEAKSPHRGAVEGPVKESGLVEVSRSGASLDSAQTLSSRPVLPEKLNPRVTVTQKPLHRGPSLLAAPHPAGPPPRSTGSASQPAVNTKTAPLVSIINGETLRLSCPASHGNTQGSLIWTMPSGKVLSRGESSDSGQYVVQQDGTLTVQHASVFDRGAYTCRSTSNDSSSVSVVTVPVIVIAYPPRITTGPSPVTYTRPGVAVELPCLTIATPRATVTWETPDLTQLRVMGQARIYGNRYLSPQGSLVIQNPTSRDTGFYRCTAKNVIGVDTKSTYLHVI